MARQRKQSVFTQEQQDSISIDSFIFHVILADEREPRYLNRVNLSLEQRGFFKRRFIDASTGTRFIFVNKETSGFYDDCRELLAASEADFVRLSQKLTANFNSFHRSNANNGIFIVSIVSMADAQGEEHNLIFLIKMDHRAVYQYKLEDNEATFEEIINTVVEEKSAMQKVAIVDLSEQFDWDILAYDRTKTDTVAEYFQNFLTAQEMEPASTLTRNCVRAVRKWARKNRTILGTGLTPEDFRDRAADYMHGNIEYDAENFIEVVVGDDSFIEGEGAIEDNLRVFLTDEGLYGISFTPKPNSIQTSEHRNNVRTREGVKIEWFGTKESKNLDIPEKRNADDNLYHITVKTNQIFENA